MGYFKYSKFNENLLFVKTKIMLIKKKRKLCFLLELFVQNCLVLVIA